MSNENKALSVEEIAEKYFGGTGTLNRHLVKDAVIAIEEFAAPLTSQITHLEGMVRQANEQNETLIKMVDGLKEELQNSEFDCDFKEHMRNQTEQALKKSDDENASLLKQVGELKEEKISWEKATIAYQMEFQFEIKKNERLLEALKTICGYDEIGIRKILKIESVTEMAKIASSALTAYEGKNTEG